jgi:HEAT repeat protein
MELLDLTLIAGTVIAITAWAALSWHVLWIQRRRTEAGTTVRAALTALEAADAARLGPRERVAAIRYILVGASRELVMRAATDRATPPSAAAALEHYLVERWGTEPFETDAADHATARDKWRRMAALRILFRIRHPRALDLLARAVDGTDPDVASVAISILGTSPDREPAAMLVRALQSLRLPPSQLAAHLDRSPADMADDLRVLLADQNPVVRQWAAALLGRYVGGPGIEEALLPLADDPDPRVRKTAIASLGQVGDTRAADAAVRLLDDPFPFVRANAARAIGDLDRLDLAHAVAQLLGDGDWWVRRAAKESLQVLGTDVWPVLVRCLDNRDRFVRNGAAEVVQNLGILDSLIVLEAATDYPASSKIDMLRRIAEAGEVRLTESLLERAGSVVGPRLRALLAQLGLAHVGAA